MRTDELSVLSLAFCSLKGYAQRAFVRWALPAQLPCLLSSKAALLHTTSHPYLRALNFTHCGTISGAD